MVNNMEWISVKDKLQELNQIVLAVLNKPLDRFNFPYHEDVLLLYRREYNYTTRREIKWERPFGGETVDYNDRVTHWMPIPEIPSDI